MKDEHKSENTSPVLAYRVSQLEKALNKGLDEIKSQNQTHANKIDVYLHSVATKSDIASLREQKSAEHARLEKKIDTNKTEISARIEKTENWLTWAGRLIIGAVMTAVLGLVIWSKNN